MFPSSVFTLMFTFSLPSFEGRLRRKSSNRRDSVCSLQIPAILALYFVIVASSLPAGAFSRCEVRDGCADAPLPGSDDDLLVSMREKTLWDGSCVSFDAWKWRIVRTPSPCAASQRRADAWPLDWSREAALEGLWDLEDW